MGWAQDLWPDNLTVSGIWSAAKSLGRYADQFFKGWPSQYISKVFAWTRDSNLRKQWDDEATWVLTFLGLNRLKTEFDSTLAGGAKGLVSPRPEGFYQQNIWLAKFTFPEAFYSWADKQLDEERTKAILYSDVPPNSLLVREGNSTGTGERALQLKVASEFLSLKVRSLVVPGCGVEFSSGEAGGPIKCTIPIRIAKEEIATLSGITTSFKEIPLFGPPDQESADPSGAFLLPLPGNVPANSFFRTYLAYISDSPWVGGVGFQTGKSFKSVRVPLFPLDSAMAVSVYLLAPTETSRYTVVETLESLAAQGNQAIQKEADYFKLSDFTGMLESVEDIVSTTRLTGNIIATAGLGALRTLVQSGGATSVPLDYYRYYKDLILRGLNPFEVYRSFPHNVQKAVTAFVGDLYRRIGLITFHMLLIPTRVSNLTLDYSAAEPIQSEVEFLPLLVIPGFRTPTIIGTTDSDEDNDFLSSVRGALSNAVRDVGRNLRNQLPGGGFP